MKFVKYLLTAITAIVLISACQKELNFETDGLAHGSLKSAVTGDCFHSTVNGIYKADSLLDINNFVDIEVDLTSTGTYDIMSDTVNGYSFRGVGTLGIAGLNTVRLYATGKPVLAQTNVFTIRFDSTICLVNVTVIGTNTPVAVYTLEGAPNTCSGAIINGTYNQGTALNVNNTVTITVNVTATGTYTLGAASAVNGMVFTSVGVFNSTGIQTITLNGAGIPLAAGTFNVTATNLSSSCTFSITVGGGAAAVFSLDGSPNNCAGTTIIGTYAVGTALTTAERVNIKVTVASIGSFTITSNTVNGMTFSRTSNFITTGPVTISLLASGTPIASGTFDFIFTGGGTTCTFSITVAAGASNQDYVPETALSNWSGRLVGGTAADTSYNQVNPNTTVINTITYKIFENKVLGVPVDSFYVRKNGGMYYELFDGNYDFDDAFNVDGLILDSNLAVNATWIINLGNNTLGGIPATGKITCTILEKGATATIAGNNYVNIIKVRQRYSYNIGAGDIDNLNEEIWYAKGKGIIYYNGAGLLGGPIIATETTRVQIF